MRTTPREWVDLGLAVAELALAHGRLVLRQAVPIGQPLRDEPRGKKALTDHTARIVNRVAWAVPRAARIVPWRADCLRQAEAARHWLARSGIEAEIRLGARKYDQSKPEMHAWLLVGGSMVTGGDILSYTPFSAGALTPR